MSAFADIELEYKGRVYTIKHNRVMRAIALIEDHITLTELQEAATRNAVPAAKLCMAYAAVLKYAGAYDASADDVYDSMFAEGETQAAMIGAMLNLIQMMLPKSARAQIAAADSAGETERGNSQATVAASSKRPTRRRSQLDDGLHLNSSGA